MKTDHRQDGNLRNELEILRKYVWVKSKRKYTKNNNQSILTNTGNHHLRNTYSPARPTNISNVKNGRRYTPQSHPSTIKSVHESRQNTNKLVKSRGNTVVKKWRCRRHRGPIGLLSLQYKQLTKNPHKQTTNKLDFYQLAERQDFERTSALMTIYRTCVH